MHLEAQAEHVWLCLHTVVNLFNYIHLCQHILENQTAPESPSPSLRPQGKGQDTLVESFG